MGDRTRLDEGSENPADEHAAPCLPSFAPRCPAALCRRRTDSNSPRTIKALEAWSELSGLRLSGLSSSLSPAVYLASRPCTSLSPASSRNGFPRSPYGRIHRRCKSSRFFLSAPRALAQ